VLRRSPRIEPTDNPGLTVIGPASWSDAILSSPANVDAFGILPSSTIDYNYHI
jgi:hypothetical protein